MGFMLLTGGILIGWILCGVFKRQTLEDAIVLVHKLDDENRRLTVAILDLHRERREKSHGKATS